jgi:ribonucleoside-diphosphate reductase alpha chain
LESLFNFSVEIFKNAHGRKLSSIECHDIVCKIAEIVVVGGVRRSAMISLSDLGDHEMRDAKSGAWWENKSHFALANNSGVYDNKPSMTVFLEEWLALVIVYT